MQNGTSSFYSDLEKRVRDMEVEQGGIRVWQANLTTATNKNTDAIEKLTDKIGEVVNTLSENKGAFWMAFKFASGGTILSGAIFAFGTWLYSVFHGVPK